MKFRKVQISSIIAFLFWISIVLYKPTMIGAILTPVAMLFSFFIFLIYHTTFKRIHLTGSQGIIVLCILYYAYCLFLYYVRKNTVFVNYIKALLSVSLLVFVSLIVLFSDSIRTKFVRLFILALVLWSLSYVCSLPVMLATRNAYALPVFQMNMPRYEDYTLALYFPVTPGFGRISIGSFQFLRLTGLFRECGIAQLFYIWAISEAEYYFNIPKWIKRLLVLGLLFCFSTMGYVNLVIWMCAKLFLNMKNSMDKKSFRRNLLLILYLVIFVIAFANIPGIRIADKAKVSFNARFGGYMEIFELFKSNPLFGTDSFVENSSSGLFQMIYQIGLVGLILYYSIILFAFFHAQNKKRFILANLAGIITLTISQPIWDAPLLFLLWAMPYKERESISEKNSIFIRRFSKKRRDRTSYVNSV